MSLAYRARQLKTAGSNEKTTWRRFRFQPLSFTLNTRFAQKIRSSAVLGTNLDFSEQRAYNLPLPEGCPAGVTRSRRRMALMISEMERFVQLLLPGQRGNPQPS